MHTFVTNVTKPRIQNLGKDFEGTCDSIVLPDGQNTCKLNITKIVV